METVSKFWRENQAKQITSEAFVEVSYYISDAELEVDSAEDNGALELLSNTSQAVDVVENREVIPYATLEENLWFLNGSKITIPPDRPGKDEEDLGFVSNQLCDEEGIFLNPPTIKIDFMKKVSILPGLTIVWSEAHDDFPSSFNIKTFDENDVMLQSKEVIGNTDVTSIVNFSMENFKRIRVEVIKWQSGLRRARIEKIFGGIKKVYNEKDLLKFSASQAVDPLSAKLPKYDVSFSINNINGEYNLNDSDSLTNYMMERQEIRTRYGFKKADGTTEWIQGGLYFLSDWDVPQNGLSASFKARDLIGFLDGTYYKGKYNAAGTSLYDLAEDVLSEAHLPLLKNKAPRWEIDDSLKDIKTKSPLSVCSFSECLQLIANAARSVIYFDRNGTLHISPLQPIVNRMRLDINADNSYSKAEISLLKPLKCLWLG